MIVVVAAVVVVLLLAVLPGVVAGPLSWALLAYVLYRAYPSVRADLRRLRAGSARVSLPLPGRAARGRGVHL